MPPERQLTFRGDIGLVQVSPDGQTIAFTVDDTRAIVIQDLQGGGTSTIFTHPDDNGTVPRFHWSHDGSRLYFQTQLDSIPGIYSLPKLGGTPSLVADATPFMESSIPFTFWRPTADGRWLLGLGGDVALGSDLGDISFDDDGSIQGDWQTVRVELDMVINAELSPDGQWLAYSSLNRAFDSLTNQVISLDGETSAFIGGLTDVGFGFTKRSFPPTGNG